MPAKKRLYLGSDHAGYALKEALKKYLAKRFEIIDRTPEYVEGDDYPKIGFEVARLVADQPESRGLLVCGSGIGMSIAANRVKKIRAALVHTPAQAKLSRHDDHANILVLAGRLLSAAKAKTVTDMWLKTPPSSAPRHQRRVKQLDHL